MISTTSLWVTNLVVISIVLFHVLIPLHVVAEEWVDDANQSLTPYSIGDRNITTTSIMLTGTDDQTKLFRFYFDFSDPKKCLKDMMTCICLEMVPDEHGMIGNNGTSGHCPGMNSWCIEWPKGTADWEHADLNDKLMRVQIEGAVDTTTSSSKLFSRPANWTLYFGKNQAEGARNVWYESLICDTAKNCSIYNGLPKNKVNITTNGTSKRFAIKAVGDDVENCAFMVKLHSENARVVVPPPTTTATPKFFPENTTRPMNGTESVDNAGFGFAWWAVLVAVAVILFVTVTVLYFLLVCLMWKRCGCFKNMDRHASTSSVSPEKPSDPKNKAALPADAKAKNTQSKEAQPKDVNDKRAPAGHDGSKAKPMPRQQEDAVTRQQDAVTNQQDDLADVDFCYINIGNVIDPETSSQSHRNTIRAKDDPPKRTHIEPSKEEPKMLQPIIAPEPSFTQALFNGQMSELRPTFFKAFIATTVVYVILVVLILAGWAVAFIMFPDYLGLAWSPIR